MTSTSQKVFRGHKKCADSSVGKASSCIWESYLEPFTKTTEFSLYERQTAAYRLICERQEDSGLQLWTAGSTQLQLDTYFFLNSSSHNIHPSTAKPQKVLCRPGLVCSSQANTPPEPSTTLQRGGSQKEPAPAATAEVRHETQAKKFYQASLQVTQRGKEKTALPYPRGKWVSGQRWRQRPEGSAIKSGRN